MHINFCFLLQLPLMMISSWNINFLQTYRCSVSNVTHARCILSTVFYGTGSSNSTLVLYCNFVLAYKNNEGHLHHVENNVDL
jgi:hypothetical protein